MPPKDWDPRSKEVSRDQRAAFDDMRARCPVAHSDLLHWSLFKHDDIVRVLHDHETFSNVVSTRTSVPNGMDPPEHTEYRHIIERYFNSERMDAYEPTCREIARGLVQHVVGMGQVELISDFAQSFSVKAQCTFLGWPDKLQDSLRDWMKLNHEATLAQDRPAMEKIARQFEGYILELLKTRRNAGEHASDDATTELMREMVWDRPLTDDELVSILRNWTAGEVGSITASIGILTHFLATHPNIQTQLREQPSLLPEAIEEILRMDGPLVANRRRVTRDVEIRGRKIRADERLSIIWVSANRDENVFEQPDTFRWGRDHSKSLLYGAGIHVCPGAPLARLEMRIVMEELLRATKSIKLNPGSDPIRAVYPTGGYSYLPVILQ